MRIKIKNLNSTLLSAILICVFCIQSYAIKYIDGRFITNVKVNQCIKEIVENNKCYKKISKEHKVCFERIGFSFKFNKHSNKVTMIELYVPVMLDCICQDMVETFYIDLNFKKDLSGFELANLFLNSDEFNEQDFDFKISDFTTIHDWNGDIINKYDDIYSIATNITEENWREKFLDPDIFWGWAPKSLLFFEIRPGEKVFVEGYDENFDE